MRLKVIDNKILGYGAFGNPEYPEYNGEVPDLLVDNHNNPLYEYINGEIVSIQDPRTEDQKEKDRTDLIEKEIPYSLAEEIALINNGIQNKEDPEYLTYRQIVEEIKLKYPKEK